MNRPQQRTNMENEKIMPNTEIMNSIPEDSDKLLPEKCGGPTVQEMHIDFLLEEEFSVNPNFLRKFVEAASASVDPKLPSNCIAEPDLHGTPLEDGTLLQVRRVERSVSDQWGEADLIVVYEQVGGMEKGVAILIEDKIRASFQPGQALRYRKRGDFGCIGKHREWERYWTCLIAPASYIETYIKSEHGFNSEHGFDAVVKLEQLMEWLAVAEPKRREFKVEVIKQAIKKAEMIGVQKVDQVMTAFRTSYFALFEEFFKDQRQDVKMRLPGPTWKGDSWFEVRSRLLPNNAYINHKSQSGFVDLTFPNTDAILLKRIEPHLEAGMRIEKTSKSAAVRLEVCKIELFDFDQERAKVEEGLSAVRRLLNFYAREAVRLDPILKIARTDVAP
jgi:hypothetical protein